MTGCLPGGLLWFLYVKRYVFYKPQYRVRWTAQSTLIPFAPPPLSDLFIPTPTRLLWEASAMLQLLHKDYALIFSHQSISSYSFIQLIKLGRRGENKNGQASKQQQSGFEPGLYGMRVRRSTAELSRSMVEFLLEYCVYVRRTTVCQPTSLPAGEISVTVPAYAAFVNSGE